ncbi:MAG: helix-turn-helix domain-containing protein [Chloroflexota bacterium]
MRSNDEYRQILRLWDAGESKLGISRKLGIPRGTVRYCIDKFNSENGLGEYISRQKESSWQSQISINTFRQAYAYVLGMYLGDGYIATHPRTYRLRVFLDARYPLIIRELKKCIKILAPENKQQSYTRDGCVEIGVYSNHWVEMFPQHGKGAKHERYITLEKWQQDIIDEFPIAFLRGLIHSDGTRIEPVINDTIYPRYQFSNVSGDIRNLFCDTLDKLEINWTYWGIAVAVARRDDVAFLDKHIGPKA